MSTLLRCHTSKSLVGLDSPLLLMQKGVASTRIGRSLVEQPAKSPNSGWSARFWTASLETNRRCPAHLIDCHIGRTWLATPQRSLGRSRTNVAAGSRTDDRQGRWNLVASGRATKRPSTQRSRRSGRCWDCGGCCCALGRSQNCRAIRLRPRSAPCATLNKGPSACIALQ